MQTALTLKTKICRLTSAKKVKKKKLHKKIEHAKHYESPNQCQLTNKKTNTLKNNHKVKTKVCRLTRGGKNTKTKTCKKRSQGLSDPNWRKVHAF